MIDQRLRAAAAIGNAVVALVMTACVPWFLHLSREAEAEAVRRFGRNIDAGALEEVAAKFYFMPGALLFGLAAILVAKRWPLRWPVQLACMLWLLIPVVIMAKMGPNQ